MSKHITLVTGGQRSGKSVFAERLALSRCPSPAYIATAQVFDEEMQQRVARHRQRRGDNWTNIEAPLAPGEAVYSNDTALLDCLTMWATNLFFAENEDVDRAFARFKDEWTKLEAKPSAIIAVTNEIGLGGISANSLQRRFTDLQGYVNQFVASRADEVFFLVSGIPVKIK